MKTSSFDNTAAMYACPKRKMTILFSYFPLHLFPLTIYLNKFNKSPWSDQDMPCAISTAVTVVVITCSALIFAHKSTSSTHKNTFPLTGSSVRAAAVSQHACFEGFLCPFPSFLSLVFTTSLSNVVLFPMKPDIVTVLSGMFFTRWEAGCVHISLPVPEKHPFEAPLFARSPFMNERGNTCHMSCKTEHTPFPGRVSEGFSLQPGVLVIVVPDVK